MEVRQLVTKGVFLGEIDINADPIRLECSDARTTLLYVGPGEPMAFRTAELLMAIEKESTQAAARSNQAT